MIHVGVFLMMLLLTLVYVVNKMKKNNMHFIYVVFVVLYFRKKNVIAKILHVQCVKLLVTLVESHPHLRRVRVQLTDNTSRTGASGGQPCRLPIC